MGEPQWGGIKDKEIREGGTGLGVRGFRGGTVLGVRELEGGTGFGVNVYVYVWERGWG